MGTWGPGNLENDYAAEELSDRCNTLLKALLERAALKESRKGDEYHYTTLYVDFEILFALARAGLWSPTSMPTPEEIKALRNDYLKDWDKNMSDWSAEKGGGPAELNRSFVKQEPVDNRNMPAIPPMTDCFFGH